MSLYAWTTTLDDCPLTVQVAAHNTADARRSALEYLEEFARIQPQRKALDQKIKEAFLWKRALDMDHAMVAWHRNQDLGLSTPDLHTDFSDIEVLLNELRTLERRVPKHLFGGDFISSYEFNYYTADMTIGENGDMTLEEFI